jgi:hypothetical protein
MSNFKETKECRVCKNKNLLEVLSIKEQFLSPTFVKTNENNILSNIKVKQTLVLCDKKNNGCGLLQLKETVNPDLLYRQYFYRTSTNEMMKNDLKKVVEFTKNNVNLKENDIVIDIGANDCTMIQWFPKECKRIGVEPAQNISWKNVESDVIIVNDYFSGKAIEKAVNSQKVKAFTSCAMFYDLDSPNEFVMDIKQNLDADGVFVIQLSYLPLMLKNMNFYDICNEHLEYYCLETLNYLMYKNGLEIYDAVKNNVNGGSVLVAISHVGSKEKTNRYMSLLEEEKQYNLFEPKSYKDFYDKILDLKNKVNNFIKQEKDKGNEVVGLGASTKGNMLLQLFEIDKSIMPYISERNADKVGLKTLGTDFELISEQQAREIKPSCMLVLPWYFKEEIVKREQEYIQNEGILLFPMPYVHIVEKNGERIL